MPPPEKKKDESVQGLSDWFDSAPGLVSPVNLPKETALESGKLGFWESLRRPGYGTNAPADLAKIVTQVGADTLGGGPYGGLMSAIGGAINPDSIRPATGVGNIASAIGGNLSKIPGVNRLPGSVQQMLGGASQGAADASDTGNNPLLGAFGGGLTGLGLGAGASYLHQRGNQLPSPAATKIQGGYGVLAGPDINIRPKLEKLEGNLSLFPKVAEAQDAILAGPAKMSSLTGLLSDAQKNFEVAEEGLSAAAQARRSAIKAQNTAKINAATKAGEEKAYAQDFLKNELPATEADIASAREELETLKIRSTQPQPPPEASPKRIKKMENDLLAREIELKDRREAAEAALTSVARNTAAGEGKLAVSAAGAGRQKVIDDATEARSRARADYTKAKAQLGSVKKEIESFTTELDAQQKFVDPFIAATGLDPSKMTPAARAALGVAAKSPVTAKGIIHSIMYTKSGGGEFGNPTLARGLREALEHDPEALGAVRSEFLREILDRHRLQKGGVNYPKIFDGKSFETFVNKFDSEAINQLFGDERGPAMNAAEIFKGMGAAAARGEELAKPNYKAMTFGLFGWTAPALMAFWNGNVMAAAGIGAVGGGTTAVLNSLPIMERFLQLPGLKGKAVAAFLQSPDPGTLPHNIIVEVSKQLNSVLGTKNEKTKVTDPVQ